MTEIYGDAGMELITEQLDARTESSCMKWVRAALILVSPRQLWGTGLPDEIAGLTKEVSLSLFRQCSLGPVEGRVIAALPYCIVTGAALGSLSSTTRMFTDTRIRRL